MRKTGILFLLALICQLPTVAFAQQGFCRKCEIMKQYHKNNPSKYTYYEDYLRDAKKNGKGGVEPSSKDLPPDVDFIMNPEKHQQK